MTLNDIIRLMEKHTANELAFEGKCHDCKTEMNVIVSYRPVEGDFQISGGAVYVVDIDDEIFFLKCEECHAENATLRNFRECEVYSRVVGYYRPMKNWNEGKKAEFKKRSTFDSAFQSAGSFF